MSMWPRRLLLVLLAAGLAAGFSGCLSTTYTARLRYDEAKDEFTVLNVYENIDATEPADSQYLYQLWRNRDHLIRLPNLDFLSMPAFLRLSPWTYAPINLGDAPKKLDPEETPIALDQIRVLPGTFFSRGPDDLCYYDQVVVPGRVVDPALALAIKHIGPDLTQEIDKELNRRRTGGKRMAWAETWRQFRKQANKPWPPTQPAASPPASQPADEEFNSNGRLENLDDQSLQLLRKSVTDGSMTLTRKKQIFRLTIPLSDVDAGQVVALWNATVEVIKTYAAKLKAIGAPPENDQANYVAMAEILPAIAMTARPSAVEVKIDLAILADHLQAIYASSKLLSEPAPRGNLFHTLAKLPTTGPTTEPAAVPATAPAAAPDKPRQMRDTIAALRAKGVPIDVTLTTDDVFRGFATHTLKFFPSPHPVPPGSGLVQAPPPEPPGAVDQPRK